MSATPNSISIGAGALVVTGTGTNFVAAAGDLLVAKGVSAVISSRTSATALALKQRWAGAAVTDSTEWEILPTSPYWQSGVAISRKLSDLIAKFDAGPIKWDASGPSSDRSKYNNQPKDFVFLSLSPLPLTLFVKTSNVNSSSSWSSGQTVADISESTAQFVQEVNAAIELVRPVAPYIARQGDMLAASDDSSLKGDGKTDDSARLKALLANTNRDIRLRKGADYLIRSALNGRLILGAGSRLHAEGASIIIDYNDTSASSQLEIEDNALVEGLTLILKTGRDVRRGVLVGVNSKISSCKFESQDQQSNALVKSNSDGLVYLRGNGSEIFDVEFIRIAQPILVQGEYCKVTKADLTDWLKGIRVTGSHCDLSDIESRSVPSSAPPEPGYNLVSGGGPYLSLDNIRGIGSGEHFIYLSANVPADSMTGRAKGLKVNHVRATQVGQNIFKARGWENFQVSDLRGDTTSFGNDPGTNENILHIENCCDGQFSDIGGGGAPGGYYGAWFQECQNLALSDFYLRNTISHGMVFAKCGRITGRDITLDTIGGDGIVIQDLEGVGGEAAGGIDIQAKMTGVAGIPVRITTTVQAAVPHRVIGTTDKVGQIWDSPTLTNFDINLHDQSVRAMSVITRRWLNRRSPIAWTEKVRRLNELIEYIEANGLVIGRLHLFGNRDRSRDLIDVLNPRLVMTEFGTLTYDSRFGFTGDGSSGFLSLGVSPYSVPGYTQDDAFFATHVLSDVALASDVVGQASASGANGTIRLNPRNASDQLLYRINDAASGTYANADARGFYLVRRTGPSAREIYKDGVLLAADTQASIASSPGNARLFNNAGAGTPYDTRQNGGFAIGAGSTFTTATIAGFSARVRAAVLALA